MTNNPSTGCERSVCECIPCVRYGFPKGGDNPRQEPKLRRVDAPVPTDATTASPVYLLRPYQFERQRKLDNPYAVANTSCIATELQDECEHTDDVVYPIHIESDAFPDVTFETTIHHISEFVESKLGCSTSECSFYFSGNRSVHAHVPKVVTTEGMRERLKKEVAEFCDDSGARFDIGIYSRKRQFRLPGVPHEKTDLPKVAIQSGWEHDRIIREAAENNPQPPRTYAEVLSDVFGEIVSNTLMQCPLLSNEDYVLSIEDQRQSNPTPLIEREDPPLTPEKWGAYNMHHFSPYANAGNGERSIAVLDVLNGPFQREEGESVFVPSFLYAARSCDGTFWKHREHAPLKLSEPDFEKWAYNTGDTVIVIGGRSRQSIMFKVGKETACKLSDIHLHPETGSTHATLTYLEHKGFDIGSAGGTSHSFTSCTSVVTDGGLTEAARLQRKAECEGIGVLSHDEQLKVANRLLSLHGWSAAWDWFRHQLGDHFDSTETRQQLRSIVNRYDDLSHVRVPTEK